LICLVFPADAENWRGLVIPVVAGSNPVVHPKCTKHEPTEKRERVVREDASARSEVQKRRGSAAAGRCAVDALPKCINP
jgi:hypothetical protein